MLCYDVLRVVGRGENGQLVFEEKKMSIKQAADWRAYKLLDVPFQPFITKGHDKVGRRCSIQDAWRGIGT